MILARWVLFAALLAPNAASATDEPVCGSPAEAVGRPDCRTAAVREARVRPSTRRPARSDEINVNPYGDPVWQQAGPKPPKAKARPHVKRSRLEPHRHAKRAPAKSRLHAKNARPKPRPTKRYPVGKPLDITPKSIRR